MATLPETFNKRWNFSKYDWRRLKIRNQNSLIFTGSKVPLKFLMSEFQLMEGCINSSYHVSYFYFPCCQWYHKELKAPSAHNQQFWRFIIVRWEKKQALAKLVSSRGGWIHGCYAYRLCQKIRRQSEKKAVADAGKKFVLVLQRQLFKIRLLKSFQVWWYHQGR